MSRRGFLKLVGGSLLGSACASPEKSPSVAPAGSPLHGGTGVRAIAFDLFTLFDPRGVDRRVAALLGGETPLAATWKTRLFEYCWIRATAGHYVDFEHLVHDSLEYAAKVHHVPLTSALEANLSVAFTELDPWPDTVATLRELKQRGLALAPLANFSPRMIEALVERVGMRDLFDHLLSTDRVRSYKPDPRAYALAEQSFGFQRREIAFAAFGSWDAAGSRWFGFPTFWVNRLDIQPDELIAADASGSDLSALAKWLPVEGTENTP